MSKRNVISLLLFIVIAIGLIVTIWFNNLKYANLRLDNMQSNRSNLEMDAQAVSYEINCALEKGSDWNALLLSDSFKEKYKTRKGIIENINNNSYIWCYATSDDVIVVNVDNDASNNADSTGITTEYRFAYQLDEAGRIDDLELLEVREVYTLNGEPVYS